MYIRRATRQDLSDIATISSKAMMTDELSLWLSPTQIEHPQIHRERCLRTTKRRWHSGKIMLVIATDENDDIWDGNSRILAYAAYEKEVGSPDDSSKTSATPLDAIERFLARIEDNYIWYFRNNLNTDKSRWRECFRVVSSNTDFHGFPRYWELDFLAVDPAYGRRGLGSQLLDWGQQRAMEDQVPLLLWASEMGEPLYLRKGFKEIGRMDFGGVVTAPVMKWDPPALSRNPS